MPRKMLNRRDSSEGQKGPKREVDTLMLMIHGTDG